jgi:hypothetical protein
MRPERDELLAAAAETRFPAETLEKVARLGELVVEIGRHPLLGRSLALKGGTALNLLADVPPRLSVDLDFNFVGALDRDEMLRQRPEIEASVERISRALGYRIQRSREEHAGRKLFLGYRDLYEAPTGSRSISTSSTGSRSSSSQSWPSGSRPVPHGRPCGPWPSRRSQPASSALCSTERRPATSTTRRSCPSASERHGKDESSGVSSWRAGVLPRALRQQRLARHRPDQTLSPTSSGNGFRTTRLPGAPW